MVVKMMRWPPWPPLSSRKFEVKIIVRRLEGLNLVLKRGKERFVVEIRWKGQRSIGLSSVRRSVKRSLSEEGEFGGDGSVEWNEEFKTVCSFSGYKDGGFCQWEVAFTVLNGLNEGPRNKVPIVGTASLNIAEYASTAEGKELDINVPLVVPGVIVDSYPLLCLSVRLRELKTAQEHPQAVQRMTVPLPQSRRSVAAPSPEKDDLSGFKAGLRKVRIFTDYVSARGAKKACREEESSDGRCSVRSEDAEYNYPFDTDSLEADPAGESEESTEGSIFRQSFSYETLAYANFAGRAFYSNTIGNPQDEGWIHYSCRKSDTGCLQVENSTATVYTHSLWQSSKRRVLPWRKRKFGFRSPKTKDEPLLKKNYGEEGGDDIDFDRRQLSSSEESSFGWYASEETITSRSSVSEFGDDNFSVGNWEYKEIMSRDGHMKLQAQVFFASIDQRSERAAGESACTALVAVIANWFQSNRDEMPIKSEFDNLIREGSLEWRNLCEIEDYRERFPDKHFDLESVLDAKIRPLSVVPEKSFIGFFHPDRLEGEDFDFLHGAMAFDSIWEEISCHGSELLANGEPLVYIVSWNDHFFVLKVEQDAFYIIDTLGERLYEGCSQAYILKFDKDVTILRLPEETKPLDENSDAEKQKPNSSREKISAGCGETAIVITNESANKKEEEVVCRGKEACKEYIKSFMAAIPIRELQADMKKGLRISTPLHHRLQIEFHCTQFLQLIPEALAEELTADAPTMANDLVAANVLTVDAPAMARDLTADAPTMALVTA